MAPPPVVSGDPDTPPLVPVTPNVVALEIADEITYEAGHGSIAYPGSVSPCQNTLHGRLVGRGLPCASGVESPHTRVAIPQDISCSDLTITDSSLNPQRTNHAQVPSRVQVRNHWKSGTIYSWWRGLDF